MARALRLLARREHTRDELRRKLSAAGESPAAIDAALDSLCASGLLSDARYAEQRVALRGRELGNSRLRHELRRSGVADELIASALSTADDEIARATLVWRKKYGQPAEDREQWVRHARFLTSRGFGSEIVRRVLKNVGAGDPDE